MKPSWLAVTMFAMAGSPAIAAEEAREILRAALGGEAATQVARFDYRLTVEDGAGTVLRDANYALQPRAARLYQRDLLATASSETWSEPQGTWRLTDGQWEFAGPAIADPLRAHVAYHFLALLADPSASVQGVAPDRLRLSPAGQDAFDVVLDAGSGRIVQNLFDDGTLVRELEWTDVGGVWWPMLYELVQQGAVTRRGRFRAVAVQREGSDAGLPPMPVETAARDLPEIAENAARLIGAGWLSSARNDYNLSTDAAQRLMVFARSDADFANSRILLSRKRGGQWDEPREAAFTDARYKDSDPWLTPDGDTMYFVSNRPSHGDTARADLDLWRVSVTPDGFGVPQPLTALSSAGHDLGPELHDGWLYFNSSRKGGPAPLSIWRARRNGDGFDPPEPMPAPFNDGQYQGDFTLSPDGRTALFWSERDGIADGDLFAVRRTASGWSKAVRLPSPINATGLDFTPSFSADGRELRFAAMRKPGWLEDARHVFNGQANIYVVDAAMIETAFEAALD
jgi:hypothetical protein